MAKYINRDKLNKKKKYLFQTKGMPFPKSEYFIKADDFYSMPTVDVIERSKIDKAIEDMNCIDLNEYADNTYQLVNECIEILKRNIGERL